MVHSGRAMFPSDNALSGGPITMPVCQRLRCQLPLLPSLVPAAAGRSCTRPLLLTPQRCPPPAPARLQWVLHFARSPDARGEFRKYYALAILK